MGILNITSELLLLEECSFLSRPLSDFQQELHHDHGNIIARENDYDKFEENLLSLEIKLPLPLLGEIKVEEDNDGCKTPTSLEQKIPLMICPPAPRKAKSIPLKKRKGTSPCRRSLLDFSTEVESMFAQAFLADLGKKIKKARTPN